VSSVLRDVHVYTYSTSVRVQLSEFDRSRIVPFQVTDWRRADILNRVADDIKLTLCENNLIPLIENSQD
jgi:hypothetical protein